MKEHKQEYYPLILSNEEKPEFIPVDDWKSSEEDMIFKTSNSLITVDISKCFGSSEPIADFNNFVISSKFKRSYNSNGIREHCCHYMNYFEKFYDMDHELLTIYARIKFLTDCEEAYTKDAFFNDIINYIASGTISVKVGLMNEDNFNLDLGYQYKKNPVLCYQNIHGKILMKISVTMCIIIPLLCHFMYKRNINQSTSFLLEIYDKIINMYDVDIYSKLYETANSNISINAKRNQALWQMQDIRGINTTLHSEQCVQNIIINIIPKYVYNKNPILYNYSSIQYTTKFQVLDIAYECAFINLSSSRRDEDLNSEFDKFESFLIKDDESLYIQKMVAKDDTIAKINSMYGPFDPKEIEHYTRALSDGPNGVVINGFQKELVFNLFYKEFGDPNNIMAINSEDFIPLIIAARKILLSNNMIILPYVISSKITKLSTRKSINRKELTRLQQSNLYPKVVEKYQDERIIKYILGLIATISSSEFRLIDYTGKYDGRKINIIPELVQEEILIYCLLI